MNLRRIAIAGVMITTLSAGFVGIILQGLSVHGLSGEVSTGELEELQKLQNSTDIAQTARERSESAEARSSFFSLPAVVNTFKTVFQSIPIWQTFFSVSAEVLGLQHARANWPMILVVSALLITIAYGLANRLR